VSSSIVEFYQIFLESGAEKIYFDVNSQGKIGWGIVIRYKILLRCQSLKTECESHRIPRTPIGRDRKPFLITIVANIEECIQGYRSH